MNKRKGPINRLASGLLVLALIVAAVPLGPLSSRNAHAQATTAVFINEIHYDNDGTDAGEAIEVAGPAGTDLTGWSLVLYNGNGGAMYNTTALVGTIPDQQNGFGTVVVNYPVNGIQNGSPDGIALVDTGNNVVQFLSYEGSFTAVDGPAEGMTSTDIGVSEGSSTALGDSLQLTGTGIAYGDFSWASPGPNTFGAVNTGQTFGGASGSPFVNEIHYDNASTDAGEAIEVAGPAGTDLTGWSLVLYNGNGGAPYNTTALSGIIPDQQGGYGTLFVSYPVNGIQNGSPDGIALVDPTNTVVQFLSYEGTFTAVGGPADGMTSTDIGVSEGSSTAIGDSLQLTGTGIAYDDFSWSGPGLNTFGEVNTGQTFGEVVNAPVIVNCGGTLYVDQAFSAYREVTASDMDGTVVNMEISVTPASDAITLENFQSAMEVGGEASATVAVGSDVDAGTFAVEVTAYNDDATPQSGTCTFNVVVNPFLTIGQVQGVVDDTDDGASHASPYVGQTVVLQGVIYENILIRTSGGSSNYAFFLQNTAATADGDPNSSDGIYVYIGYYPTLRVAGGGYYTPKVGDEVILRGPISEYYNLTEVYNPYLLQVVDTEVNLDNEVPAFEANPPSELGDANRYWERREGMRAQVPADSVVLNGRDVFASTMDGEVWVATPDSVIAQRTDPYARRAFRDPHPLDDIPDQLFDNGNGYRVLMGSLGIKATAGDNTALIAPARTFDTLANAPIGGVYYSYGKYSVQVGQQIELAEGVDPALNAPPEMLNRALEYSVVTFNVENLYDYYDDPFDGCDFAGNPGCPGVYPPFDYVPPSDDVYQARLLEIAQQIVSDLHSPDIIMAQEAEDQDVCTVVETVIEWEYTCGTTNNADGKPDTLQELAAVIYNLSGVPYDAAYDRDGADDRGIVSAYLYRTDRVELLPAQADDPVLGEEPQVDYDSEPLSYNTDVQNPKVLNAVLPDWVTGDTDGDNVFTRAPQVGLFRVWRDGIGGSVFEDLYLIDNHFSSGPDGRVGQRTEQAAYNAAIVAALQQANPGVYVSAGGDLNVYPRPDDPFPPPDTSDQLAALYSQGMTNLWDILVTRTPASAYGYVYQGQAQTLDQIFVASSCLDDLANVWSAHINSDFPADYAEDGPRGTSDHDPVVAGYMLLPTLDRLEALVSYFDANGEITGNQTTRILLDRLDRARRFMERGQQDAYEDQLWAFISQVWDFTPQFITEHAAQALEQETTLLLSLP